MVNYRAQRFIAHLYLYSSAVAIDDSFDAVFQVCHRAEKSFETDSRAYFHGICCIWGCEQQDDCRRIKE